MQFEVITPDGNKVWQRVVKGIKENKITTWEIDDDGDITHTAAQWKKKAWIRHTVVGTGLVLKVIFLQGAPFDPEVASIYVGHFTGTLLRHCSDLFTKISVPPLS